MKNKKLIPAPVDDKNILTDWIDGVFDEKPECCGRTYTGIANGIETQAKIYQNQVRWKRLTTSNPVLLDMLRTRIEELLSVNGDDIVIEYEYLTMRNSQTTLIQSFWFTEE